MAVLDDVPGIEVTVQINGQDAVEYDDPDAAELDATCPTSSKYIECIDDAEFTIQYKITRHYQWGYKNYAVHFKPSADGCGLNGHFFLEQNKVQNKDQTQRTIGSYSYDAETNRNLLQRCKFSTISTVDDSKRERVKEDTKAAEHLGLIEIKVSRAVYIGDLSLGPRSIRQNKLEFAEKALKGKAISHGVSFASAEAAANISYVKLEDREPIAVFRFHYRSRESLKRELIIPRSPPSSPSLSSLPRAELERLAKERLDQLRAKKEVKEESKSVIKREAGEVYDLTEDNASPRPMKHSRLGSRKKKQVIDLTDD